MLDLLPGGTDGAFSLLAIGAHSDDVEIGCGGTVLQLAAWGLDLRVTWVVLSGAGGRAGEARAGAAAFLDGIESEVRLADFRDGFFPHEPSVKEYFEQLKPSVHPDLILTHSRSDLHQDHRTVCELTWNTFRDHTILEYEIPKYDGDLASPNVFVPLAKDVAERKVGHLGDVFATQRQKDWFTPDLFLGLMRIRGAECRSPSGFAEAFAGRKLRLGPV